MGDMKLCLLLLLGTCALTESQDIESAEGPSPTCLLAKRFKSFRKYEYQYVAETQNQLSGTASLRNGPKVTCKVEMEVPQACSFILRTTECTLAEVSEIDPAGQPVYTAAAGAEVFQAAMEKHTLKFMVEDLTQVKLFPEEGEPSNILNIKRGIISSLLVPVMEEENNRYMATIHGLCQTDFTVNSREEIATDVTVTRDLSKCDHFSPMKDTTSPLALVTGLHFPVSLLVRSTQTCSYQFDNKKKHMTAGTCTEKHIFLLGYGLSTLVKQTLTLQEFSKTNNRVFGNNEANLKALHMETAEEKAPIQTSDQVLSTLRELSTLSQTQNGHQRAALFQKLVVEIRMLRNETLGSVVTEMLEVSQSLTLQALTQCGTPECTSAILQVLRTFHSSALEVDAAVYALGLLPNPSKHHIQDMLSMAQHKQSKAILYALSNSVRRFYQNEGIVTPEMTAVSEFMTSLLGSDCSGDKDLIFLTLRVIGNMGEAMEAANPAVKASLLQCVRQPAAPLFVQQAAIQAFRHMAVDDQTKGVLLQTALDSESPLQKRVAAYLILMRKPEPASLAQVIGALFAEKDPQFKSFVASHMANILSSENKETQQVRQKITEVLQGNKLPSAMEFSRNFKTGAMEGNVIFDSTGYMPKEVMLETTLEAFGYHLDMLEVGMEGKGFEPTIEALFGENGFFPDTVLRTMYWAGDKMPKSVNEVLKTWMPMKNERMKRQAEISSNVVKEIGRGLNKLMKDLKKQQSPEATAYLRILGAELGYIRSGEMKDMASVAGLFADHLLKSFPTDFLKSLISTTDNDIFAHYIFMDSEVFLPTSSGFPLKFSLSGTFAPGAKGGLRFSPKMQEVSFMPSMGVEFVTRMGVHIPQFIVSGIEMHTTVYHESALNAKVVIADRQIKLAIPAPQGPTQLLNIRNKYLSVTSTGTTTASSGPGATIDHKECSQFFAGLNRCIKIHIEEPVYDVPRTGEFEYSMEIEPTGEVTEYTAAIAYETGGKEGWQWREALKLTLKAEGAQPSEALTSEVMMGSRIKANGIQSFTIDVTHNSIPQMSLDGHIKFEYMNSQILLQLLAPSLSTEAMLTSNLKLGNDLTLELESSLKVADSSSLQKVTLRYDVDRVEVDILSDLNSELQKLVPTEAFQKIIDDLLDQTVDKTDMKLRHIISKSIEAGNIWLNEVADDVPYMKKLKNILEFTLPSIPEKIFLKSEGTFRYQFNKNSFTVTLPLPLGGKTSMDLNFPPTITTPRLTVPQIGLEIPSREISVPSFSIPFSYDLTVPFIGMAQLSAKVNSNFYTWEGSFNGGRETTDNLSYIASYKVVADSPVELLSYKIQGAGLLAALPDRSLKALVESSLSHKLIEASFSTVEVASLTDKVTMRATSKIEASSPLGLQTSLYCTFQSTLGSEGATGDSNVDGSLKVGSLYGNSTYSQSFLIYPFRREARGESALRVDSSFFQAQHRTDGTFSNGVLSVMSTSDVHNKALKHTAEISYKDSQLSLKSDAVATVLGTMLQNKAELAASGEGVTVRSESRVGDLSNQFYSLLSGSLDAHGLKVNSDGAISFEDSRCSHEATLTLGRDGLNADGTTTLQSNLLTFENSFKGGIDGSGTTLSLTSKGSFQDIQIENTNNLTLTLTSLAFSSKADNFVCDSTSYKHDISIYIRPFIASVKVNNDIKLIGFNVINEGQLKLEPSKMDLTGSVKGTIGDEELRHTYEFKYADLAANMKCSTNGKILGAHVMHKTDLDVAGLAATFSSDSSFNSRSLRLSAAIRALAKPFVLRTNVLFNSDGDVSLYGKHAGQLYSKFLFKAEPLAATYTYECRASTSHQLENGASAEYQFDYKADSMLTPQEQTGSWRVKSKLNDHEYAQEVNAYNNLERIGMQLSGTVRTDLLNMSANKKQEFSLSGTLKYDKNSDSHFIELPFIASLPVIFEQLKTSTVSSLETLQMHMQSEEFRAKLENLPQHMSDYVRELDLENEVIMAKDKLIALSHEYEVTLKHLEASLENLLATIKTIIQDLTSKMNGRIALVKEMIESGAWSNTVSDIFTMIEKELRSIDTQYKISESILSIVKAVEDIITKVDLQELKDSSLAWLQDFDAKHEIRVNLQKRLGELKQAIETFDIVQFIRDFRNYFASFNIGGRLKHLVAQISTEEITQTIDSIMDFIERHDFTGRISAVYTTAQELMVKYEIDKKIEAFMDKIVELIKKLKIKEKTQSVVNILKSYQLQELSRIPTELVYFAAQYLKEIDFKMMIDHVNQGINFIVEILKSFNYIRFVDVANEIIRDLTTEINEQIKALEIPQAIEACREFLRQIQDSITSYLVQLREIKVADLISEMKTTIDNIFLKNIKTNLEYLRQKVNDMDIENEISLYLQHGSEYYTSTVSYIGDHSTNAIQRIHSVAKDQEIFNQIKQIIEGVFNALKEAELNIPSFTVPFTDLAVPANKIKLHNLQEITIPARFSIPEFSILEVAIVPAITIDFEEIKQKIIAFIDSIRNLDIELPEPEALFRDLRMNYMSDLPLPEFTLTIPEIHFPEIVIPKLDMSNFDINTLQIPEIKLPPIPSEFTVPAFGKLYGEVRVNSPHYTLLTSAEILNSTTNANTPKFTAHLSSKATSTAKVLEYTFDSNTHLAIPKMSRLIIKENLKVNHIAFSVEHQGMVTLYGTSVQASAKTTAKATTDPYAAELINSAFFALEDGMSTSLETAYNHTLNVPSVEISSQVTLTQKVVARLEAGTVSVDIGNSGNGKWSFKDYSDQGIHQNNISLTFNAYSAKFNLEGALTSKNLKMKQNLAADSDSFSHINFEGIAEIESPFIKSSLVDVKGRASVKDLIISLTGSHNTELIGAVSGSLSNSITFLARPSEFVFDSKNKENIKTNLPFKLAAKIDLQNDYSLTLNNARKQSSWFALARFNQYKYSHNVTANDNEEEVGIYVALNGDANLDFLAIPITIPESTIPVIYWKTPQIDKLSLWDHTSLKHLLTTPEQSLDMNFQLKYQKNVDTMGNLISDFSFKSAVITLNTNAGLYNQDDIVARFGVSSTSVFNVLKGKFDSTTSLSTKTGIKLATAFTLEHSNIEGTHEGSLSLTGDSMDASLTTVAKVRLPITNFEFRQELTGKSKAKPNVASKMKLKYSYNLPSFDATGKGDIDQSLQLDSEFSLESSTKGNIEGTMMEGHFDGFLNCENNIYLNGDGLRSTAMTHASFNVNSRDFKICNLLMKEDLTLEVSQSRLYAVMTYNFDNEVNFAQFNSKGKHVAKATVDFTSLDTLTANVDIDVSQPSSIGEASFLNKISLEMNDEKQKFSWYGKEQLISAIYTVNMLLSNDETEALIEMTDSMEGPVDFLKAIELPIYQKNLWEVLGFDQVTSEEKTHVLRGFFNMIYTKNKEGLVPRSLASTVKVSSPIYTTTWTASLENEAPTFLVSLKSSCSSTMTFLQYDLDATATARFEDTLSLNDKCIFTHSDLKVDWKHSLTQPLRMKRQASLDEGGFHHSLNVEVTSPMFTDLSFSHTLQKNGLSNSLYSPSSGYLGFLLQMETPTQVTGRLYSRYLTAPEKDVEILTVTMSVINAKKLNLQTSWNMEAPYEMFLGLKSRVPTVTASLSKFTNKYHRDLFGMDIGKAADELKSAIASSSMPDLPEMSQFLALFENLVTPYLTTVQSAMNKLRETPFQLPGFEKSFTVQGLVEDLTSLAAAAIENFIQAVDDYLQYYADILIENFSAIEVRIPTSNKISTGKEFLNNVIKIPVHDHFKTVLNRLRNGLDNFSIWIAYTFDDALKVDSLDALAVSIRDYYVHSVSIIESELENISTGKSLERLNEALQVWIDTIVFHLNDLSNAVFSLLQQASENSQSYMKLSDQKLEIDIPLSFLQ